MKKLVFLLITLSVFLYVADLYRIKDYLIPNEIREGANAAMVEAFVRGENPYQLSMSEGEAPPVFYMYPFLNNMIAAAIVKLSGISSILVLYVLNMICSIGIGIVIYKIIKAHSNHILIPTLGFLFARFCCWRYSYVSGFPDNLAILLLVLMIFMIDRKVKCQNIFLSILSILIFYTKQYAIGIGISTAIYLLLTQRKEGIKYILTTGIMGLISIILVNRYMPLYFTETLFLMSSSTDNKVTWMIKQAGFIVLLFLPLFLFILVIIIKSVKCLRKGTGIDVPGVVYVDLVKVRLSISSIHMICSGILLIFYFGQNTGSMLSYYLQLLLPAVIVVGLLGLDFLLTYPPISRYRMISVGIAIAWLIFPAVNLHTTQLPEEQKQGYQELYNDLDDVFEGGGQILTSPIVSFWHINNGVYLYDYGQNSFLHRTKVKAIMEKYKDSALLQFLFPDADDFVQTHGQYREKMLNNVLNKYYERLYLTDEVGHYVAWDEFNDAVKENYKLIKVIELMVSSENYYVKIYEKLAD